MERMEGLRRINSYEKYVEAKQRLEDYLKQYKWITEAKTPYEDIKNMLTKCVETRKEYEDKTTEEKREGTPEERTERRKVELDNENKILALKLQYEALKGDTYIGDLRRNIKALYITIGEYEARLEAREEPETKEQRRELLTSRSMRRFRFMLASLTGFVPGEVNMHVEKRSEIPTYIMENYDLVNKAEFTPASKEETALVVVPEYDTTTGIFYRLFDQPVNEFIASRGIVEKDVLHQVNAGDVSKDKGNKELSQEINIDKTHTPQVEEHHTVSHKKKEKEDNDINIE